MVYFSCCIFELVYSLMDLARVLIFSVFHNIRSVLLSPHFVVFIHCKNDTFIFIQCFSVIFLILYLTSCLKDDDIVSSQRNALLVLSILSRTCYFRLLYCVMILCINVKYFVVVLVLKLGVSMKCDVSKRSLIYIG